MSSVGNTRDKVMTIFFFSIFRGVVCSKWRKFGHVSVSISKHAIINGAGGNLRRSPCAEEMIPPALVAQQAAIAAAMSYVFIVGCFHDSKLIAISRGNAGILHYLLSALMVISFDVPKRHL